VPATSSEELHCIYAIQDDTDSLVDRTFQQRFRNQPHVSGIVFDKKDFNGPLHHDLPIPGSASGASQLIDGPAPLGPANPILVHTEIVRHLVPYCIFEQPLEMRWVAGHPFVGALKNRDAVGHGETVIHASRCQRPAFIESEEARSWRLRLNHECHVIQTPPKSGRHSGNGSLYQLIELAGRHALNNIVSVASKRADDRPRKEP
jgi:hypothetical protein